MKVEHFALDGSTVSIEADADLNLPITATGWAIAPALLRAHPFSTHIAGYSAIVEKAIRSGAAKVEVLSQEEFSMKDGKLRVAEISLPAGAGGNRVLTVGAWEGRSGCLTTSIMGKAVKKLVEVFDTLSFGPRENGLVIHSRVVPLPRAPEVIKEVPGLGILSIRPAISSELDRIPKATGFRTENGELFRYRRGSNALLYVGASAVARVTPLVSGKSGRPASEKEVTDQAVKLARGLRVEWLPRAA